MSIVLGQVWTFWIAVFLVVAVDPARAGHDRRVRVQGGHAPLPQALTPMAGAVDWGFAEWVAIRAAGREPFAEAYHYDSLAARLRPS